jgi:hypothetical protein
MEGFPSIGLSEDLPHELQIRVKRQTDAHYAEDQTRDKGCRGFPLSRYGLELEWLRMYAVRFLRVLGVIVSIWCLRLLEGLA